MLRHVCGCGCAESSEGGLQLVGCLCLAFGSLEVDDSADLELLMASYYRYFAMGTHSCRLRWSERVDEQTGVELLSGCLPFYDSGGQLAGVTCMDLDVVVPVSELKQSPHWTTLKCQMEQMSRECSPVYLDACRLAQIREDVPAGVQGDSCDVAYDEADCGVCVDPSCRDDPSFVDERGDRCEAWAGRTCDVEEATADGFMRSGILAVRASCAYSCKLCSWLSDASACGEGRVCSVSSGNRECTIAEYFTVAPTPMPTLAPPTPVPILLPTIPWTGCDCVSPDLAEYVITGRLFNFF